MSRPRPACDTLTNVLRVIALTIFFGACCSAQNLWIGFRYDSTHVLFYARKLRDPGWFNTDQLKQLRVPDPAPEYGRGGSLLPLTKERLASFTPAPAGFNSRETGNVPALGTKLIVFLGRAQTAEAVADRYVEQWGIENPIVRVGILARIDSTSVALTHTVSRAYLVSNTEHPEPPPTIKEADCTSCTKHLLNSFTGIGSLFLQKGESSWIVTLFRGEKTGLVSTELSYAYGD
jgi:hypothetical protein